MKLNFDTNVEPFFQALVTKTEDELTTHKFYAKFIEVLKVKNNHSNTHLIEFVQPTSKKEIVEDHFLAACLKHRQVPTWYQSEEKIDLTDSTKNVVLNVEYDLLVFYRKDQYIFLHTNCSQIFSLLEKTLEELFVDDGIKSKRLNGLQLNTILNQFDIEYRSLGIQNHFGCGGTAPDAKTYYSKDASNSLTPSFDAGYGFNYCISSMKFNDGTRKPFGCSKNKSKIWTSWVADLDEFCEQCDSIVKWLGAPQKDNPKLDVLVQSVSIEALEHLTPIEFFLDYYILQKGLVFLSGEPGLTLDWTCKYDYENKDVTFDLINDDVITSAKLGVVFNKGKGCFDFNYTDDSKLMIAFAELETNTENLRKIDLVDFLNKQHNFTILFDEPYAYRDEECWEDNRLKKEFTNISGEIDWSEVDIKKESRKSATGKLNILDKIEEHFSSQPDVIFQCKDDGANEIADYMVLYENKIILIHSKYASSPEPNLSIGDIQVVASQTVKNARFFLSSGYSNKILERLYEKAVKKAYFKDVESFRKKLFQILQDKDSIKQCWIVQPGISIEELKKDKANKMHIILNFINSIMRVNNIQFTLIANSNSSKKTSKK